MISRNLTMISRFRSQWGRYNLPRYITSSNDFCRLSGLSAVASTPRTHLPVGGLDTTMRRSRGKLGKPHEKLGKNWGNHGRKIGKPVDFSNLRNLVWKYEKTMKKSGNIAISPGLFQKYKGKCGMEKPVTHRFHWVVEHGVLFWGLFFFGFKTV